MNRKKRLITLLASAAILIGLPSWLVYHEVRREWLNKQLIAAIESKQYDDALTLLQRGADGTARKEADADPSLKATISRLVDRLLHHGPPASDSSADYAIAILYGDHGVYPIRHYQNYRIEGPAFERLAEELVKRGTPTDMIMANKDTLLTVAVWCHHHGVVRALMSVDHGLTSSAARAVRWADATDTNTLLSYGVNTEDTNHHDKSTATFRAGADKLNVLIAHGAKVNVMNSEGETPLHMACAGDNDAVRVLLQHGAFVNVRDRKGAAPILLAAHTCSLETVKQMVECGADVRSKNKNGDTVLMYSVGNPDRRVFKWMLEQGIDLNSRGSNGHTALSIAKEYAIGNPRNGMSRSIVAAAIRELHARGAIPANTSDWWPGNLLPIDHYRDDEL